MRILLATPLYPPDIGGPATYAKILEEELSKQGVEIDVLTFSEVRKFPNVIRHVLYFFKVLFRGNRADIIFSLDALSVGWPAFFANLIIRKKFMVKIVGDHVWEQGVQRFEITDTLDDFKIKFGQHNLYLVFLSWLRNLVVCHADFIITPSEYLKKIVMTWGVTPEKIVVIPNAFEGVGEVGNRDALRAMMGFKGTMIMSAGRLVPWKGFRALAEIMPQVLKRIPDAKLVIAGEGPERGAIEALIEERSLKDSVILTGTLRQDILHSYIRAADLFVLNTGYEGFSHLLLEVMALGTPLVTTNVGGNPELVANGRDGVLVPFNDRKALFEAVTGALTDPLKAQGFARNAVQKAKAFSKERMVTSLLVELGRVR